MLRWTLPRRCGLCAALLLPALGWFLAGPGARADVAPAADALRAELARVRTARSGQLPDGALLSIEYTIDVAERIERGFAAQSELWRRRAARWLARAQEGHDPVLEERGKLVMRGYRSPISQLLQGYAVYVPPNYDPARAYPLLIMLHGGSANGNLFLGVVLGNNMNWKEYSIHLWDEYEPRYAPDWIVVAPDGFGQVMWRWMGEQDVLDVLADVERHYHVDRDRVVLGGLSNGGVGAYNIGMRHAHRFSVVQAIAGAPSWLQYSGGSSPEAQAAAMVPLSGMQLGENAINTDFRYYHGRVDPGPMRPKFVEELGAHMRTLGVPFKETWFDAGHDLLYLVHRHGRVYDDLAKATRKRRPNEVRVLTGDYRAARQHWVEVTRLERPPQLARVRAVVDGAAINVETTNTLAFALDLREAPLADSGQTAIVIDGARVYAGARAALGQVIHLVREGGRWRTGFPAERPGALEKKPGSSGPITDAYYGAIAHVYGTADPAATDTLKRAAEQGAQGWPLWLWRLQQPVVADTEVTDALMRSHHLVLYATPGSNRVLERIAAQLPIRVESDAVVVGAQRFSEAGVGVKYIYPNPLAPGRYVIVQAAPSAQAVQAGNKLPDFLPDYVVYGAKTTASRPRLVFGAGRMPAAMGYFDRLWKLPGSGAAANAVQETGAIDGDPEHEPPAAAAEPDPGRAPPAHVMNAVLTRPLVPVNAAMAQGALAALAPLPDAPAPPPRPVAFTSAARTQAGQAARQIARLVPSFMNYRAKIPRARWVVDPVARWSIRDNRPCLTQLREQGIHVQEYETLLPTPVPAPVEVTGPIAGVKLIMMHTDRTLLMSCELAARLPALAQAVAPHGVRSIGVISAYRDKPRSSFHTLGLALDMARFVTDAETLSVEHDFEQTPEHETCGAPPPTTARAAALRDIACRLGQSLKFSSVLTPNYNEGHRDHFHIDIRPDDPRVFVR